jgi:hypothetical protein
MHVVWEMTGRGVIEKKQRYSETNAKIYKYYKKERREYVTL